jgi:SAM-dependent methyltransferase
MDIQRVFIDWCNQHLATANGAFEFYHQDIFNGGYNPTGKIQASEYKFPFEDASFDAIILYSVFTHMVWDDARNYLREIARLLKPGGRCYSTWFLMTQDAEIEYLLPSVKEGQVGYGFPYCVNTLEKAGLRIDGFQLGKWNGAKSAIWQDLLWLRRAKEVPNRFPWQLPIIREADNPLSASGTLENLDPISSSLTLADTDGSTLKVAFSRQTRVQAHGKLGRLSDLRAGQQARVQYVETQGST